jgi:hypothetical protein
MLLVRQQEIPSPPLLTEIPYVSMLRCGRVLWQLVSRLIPLILSSGHLANPE